MSLTSFKRYYGRKYDETKIPRLVRTMPAKYERSEIFDSTNFFASIVTKCLDFNEKQIHFGFKNQSASICKH